MKEVGSRENAQPGRVHYREWPDIFTLLSIALWKGRFLYWFSRKKKQKRRNQSYTALKRLKINIVFYHKYDKNDMQNTTNIDAKHMLLHFA